MTSNRGRARRIALGACLALAWLPVGAAAERVLRVCSDPNNLPFSNAAGEGFENAIAEIVAAALAARVEYTWWAQRRGFIRNTLDAGLCDVVMGVPAGYERTATTRPYYRSTYVFVSNANLSPPLASLDDPRLHELSVGVHLTGDDGANPPPAHALGARGIVDNVVGFMIYGDYREANPAARVVEAVAEGRIDAAAVWGPIGGYFAKRTEPPLAVAAINDTNAVSDGPFVFSIAVGVRRGDTAMRDEIDAVLAAHEQEIARVLDDFGVPRDGSYMTENDSAPFPGVTLSDAAASTIGEKR